MKKKKPKQKKQPMTNNEECNLIKEGDHVARIDGQPIFGYVFEGVVDTTHKTEKRHIAYVTTIHPEYGFNNSQTMDIDELKKIEHQNTDTERLDWLIENNMDIVAPTNDEGWSIYDNREITEPPITWHVDLRKAIDKLMRAPIKEEAVNADD